MSKSNFKPNSTVDYNTFDVSANKDSPSKSSTKMYYKLTPVPSRDALVTIKEYIETVPENVRPNHEFISDLEKKLNNNDVIFQGFLNAPSEDICKQVIGKGGCYFYQTTTKNGIAMIWHDRIKNRFLFWGPKFNLIKSMNIIKHRIDKFQS